MTLGEIFIFVVASFQRRVEQQRRPVDHLNSMDDERVDQRTLEERGLRQRRRSGIIQERRWVCEPFRLGDLEIIFLGYGRRVAEPGSEFHAPPVLGG
jgi:hypothetical protein